MNSSVKKAQRSTAVTHLQAPWSQGLELRRRTAWLSEEQNQHRKWLKTLPTPSAWKLMEMGVRGCDVGLQGLKRLPGSRSHPVAFPPLPTGSRTRPLASLRAAASTHCSAGNPAFSSSSQGGRKLFNPSFLAAPKDRQAPFTVKGLYYQSLQRAQGVKPGGTFELPQSRYNCGPSCHSICSPPASKWFNKAHPYSRIQEPVTFKKEGRKKERRKRKEKAHKVKNFFVFSW